VAEKDRDPVRESDRQVDTVAKAMTILNCFSASEPELSLKSLSEMTGLYKSRIMRLCGTLSAQGFLVKTSRATYKLGPRLLILGKIYEKTHSLLNSSGPILESLVSTTGESAAIFVREGTIRYCLVKKDGPSPLRYSVTEGEPLPLYAGAPGKVLLAYATPEARRQILSDTTLERITSTTITGMGELEQELETIRRKGYAISQGEVLPDAISLAAPVFDHDSKVNYSLQIGGPSQRLTPDRWPELIPKLLDCAKELSVLMGKKG